ncbi:MAG: thiamine pyrophosphate-dependent enzyme [bacterium]
MASLKELSTREDRLTGGHRLCAGCGASIAVRQILLATNYPVVVGCATGCLEVGTTTYPYTAWKVPFIHSAFENVAATVSGIEAAYKALKRRGRIPKDKEIKFIAFGGDGGTYDIGLQALSGAMERGHDMLYVCYNNQAYMNTGIQRSSATECGTWTTTTPVGEVLKGKPQFAKDLTGIMAAHNIPYVAQTTIGRWNDLVRKVEKAMEIRGPKFINILAPCLRGWRYPADKTVEIARLAMDTCAWPCYEVENGEWKLTYKPKEKKPIIEWLKFQDRFRHMQGDEEMIQLIQKHVDEEWEKLLKRCGEI